MCASAWVEHSVSEETATAGGTRGGDATREQDAIPSALGQPVYVSTPDGAITYVNPAAVTVLGFADATELIGLSDHWLVHHKRPDGTPFPVEDCPLARCRETGEPVSVEDDWWVRHDGSMIPVACAAVPFEAPGGYGVVVSFTDLTTRRTAERAAHDLETARRQLKVAADEQAALRTVATLVARGAPQADVFAVVAREVASCLDLPLVSVIRFDAGETAVHVGAWGRENPFPVGTSWELDEHGAAGLVYHSDRPARVDYAHVPGPIAARLAHEAGIRTAVAVPIIVSGRLWGAMMALSTAAIPQPDTTEARLASFTELIAITIANAEARRELRQLADEQAALRQVATLVARGAEPSAVFDAVCEETGRLTDAAVVNLSHFTPDGTNVTMAGWSRRGNHLPPGTRLPLDGQSVGVLVKQTRAPSRVDNYDNVPGQLAARVRELGIRSGVGAPVIVDGSVWGVLIAGTDQPEPLPAGTELRVASFAELIATAVSNATVRSELIESRTRMITTFDAARRRVTRDLHDGAQQRFISAIINLQLALEKLSSEHEPVKELLDLALQDASSGVQELREIAAGIHPGILTHRGLAAALDRLAARLPIPVELDVPGQRLPEPIESSIYFFCSEALTNVVKHAQASSARLRVALEDDRYTVEVRDDGIGGADARPGTSGLTGLRDRIGALKGVMEISSPGAGGTVLQAWIPLLPGATTIPPQPGA
jgi:PAS domain S-box-containing protein